MQEYLLALCAGVSYGICTPQTVQHVVGVGASKQTRQQRHDKHIIPD